MNAILKRLLDIALSLLVLLITLPLLLLIAILIKADSQGPIFFRQKRITKYGKEFKILKFRSMVVNAEKLGSGLYNFQDDSRVTKIGKFIRNTSIDELPQLLNVLKGDMSVVGPRPSVVDEIGQYSMLNKKYRKRYEVKGGLTGLAQINGRNDLPWTEKIEFDNKYVDLYSKYGILVDLKIIMLTFISVFKAKDIYEIKHPEYVGLEDEEIAKIETKKIIAEATRKDGEKHE